MYPIAGHLSFLSCLSRFFARFRGSVGHCEHEQPEGHQDAPPAQIDVDAEGVHVVDVADRKTSPKTARITPMMQNIKPMGMRISRLMRCLLLTRK